MKFQIVFDNFFCKLSGRNTEIPARPKPPTPISLFQLRKTLEQWSRYLNVHVVLTDNAIENFYFKGFTSLADQFSNRQSNVSFQDLIAIFRHKKMILNLKNCVTTIAVLHNGSPFFRHFATPEGLKDKSNCLKGGGFNHAPD